MGVAVIVIVVLISAVFISLPSAHIVLVPEGVTYSRVISVSVDPELTTVDLQRSVIPSRRIGDEFESFVEIGTSGRGFSFSGRAQGQVLFTNLLGQDYRVPSGTVVRTTSGSYPVRFATTQEVTIPAFGQAPAPIRALDEGPNGNVDPYQINLVEGVVGFAVRVTNPNATGGAESTTVAVVAEADRERAWGLAAQQVMAEAYNGLQDPTYLEPGEFLPHQALIIQATPKQAYTHLVGEETATLGLSLRLLVTGQVVNVGDAQAVAFRQLAMQLPEGYELIDARFQYGEAAEEDVGPGLFTFYVTAEGYAAAEVDAQKGLRLVRGKSSEDATKLLMESLPLARPPEITVKPDWFPLIPLLPIRTTIEIDPGGLAGLVYALSRPRFGRPPHWRRHQRYIGYAGPSPGSLQTHVARRRLRPRRQAQSPNIKWTLSSWVCRSVWTAARANKPPGCATTARRWRKRSPFHSIFGTNASQRKKPRPLCARRAKPQRRIGSTPSLRR